MRRNTTPPRKGPRIAALLVALVIFAAALFFGTRSVVQTECEL